MSFPECEQARPKVNARLYSPYLGRFVSPDPLLNSEGGPLDYNPYVYARNNPYKYIDRNGEFWWLVAAAIFGGGANVMANFDNVNSVGDFLCYFGIGAAAGAGSACIGAWAAPYIISAMGGSGLSALSGAAIGATVSASNYMLQGGLNSAILGIPFEFSMSDFGINVGVGAILGGIGGYESAKANGLNPWTGKSSLMATRHRPLMTGPDKLAAIPNAEKSVSPVSESLSGNDSWELLESRAVSRYSSDGNVVKILRPEINGYEKCLIKTDMHHAFPYSFDEDVVKYGFSKISKNGDSFGYILPGYHAGEAGFFHINMNKQNMIYHRSFYKWADRFDMYVGKKGVDEVYFFER